MKLAPVLTKYLIAHNRLDLPGVGSFYIDNTYNPDIDPGRKGYEVRNIRFEEKKFEGFDNDLIDFVSKETGKMKVLAESDLHSQTEDLVKFVYTGKPYTISGIGTISILSNGKLVFEPEVLNTEKKKTVVEKKEIPQAYIDETTPKSKSNKPAIIITALVLLAVAAAIWFYVHNNKQDNTEVVQEAHPAIKDSSTAVAKHDSIQPAPATTPAVNGDISYLIETAQNPRATKRFNQLKTLKWPVSLETKDSVSYNIVLKLPLSAGDTTHIKDSLSALSGKKVSILH